MSGNNNTLKENFKEFYEELKPLIGGVNSVIANKFDKANLYSEDEQIIGRWIDGKPIYQKTTDSISGIDVDVIINKTEQKSSSNGIFTVSISKASNARVVNISVVNNGSTIYTHAFACDIYGVYSAVTIENAFTINNVTYWIKSWGTNNTSKQSVVEIYMGDTLVGSGYSVTTGGDNASYPSSGSFNIDIKARITYQYTKNTDEAIAIGSDTDYSLEEKIIGTDIDGNLLYQKTVEISNIALSGVVDVNHNINGIEKIVKIEGTMIYGTSTHNSYDLPVFGSSKQFDLYINKVTDTYIRFIASNFSANEYESIRVTLQYTKTTD